jgi:hypothetical protein
LIDSESKSQYSAESNEKLSYYFPFKAPGDTVDDVIPSKKISATTLFLYFTLRESND